MNKLQKKNRKSGFTLIEIIAVLVILAILAAVAIPRFISLIDDARDKSLDGAVAAGISQCSLAYGRLCLQNGVAPNGTEVATEANANTVSGGDFTYTYTAAGNNVTIVATSVADTTRNKSKVWTAPQG